MKIYKYYKGKMYNLEVRETSKMYIFDKVKGFSLDRDLGFAFDFTFRFPKDKAHTSPLEAINHAITVKNYKIGYLQKQLVENCVDLNLLEELKKTYN